MKKKFFLTLLSFLGVFVIVNSIDLVKVQKKEKERRKNISKSKYILTDNSLTQYTLKKNKSFVKTDKKLTESDPVKKKSESKNKENGEKYWRGRLDAINNGIKQLKKQIEETQSSLNKASSDYLIASTPSRQNQLREKVDKLSKQIAEFRANLKMQESNKEKFFDEARRGGALPGWLR